MALIDFFFTLQLPHLEGDDDDDDVEDDDCEDNDDVGNVSFLRGLVEILQLDLLLQDKVFQPQTHSVSWRLEMMGDTKDGVMKIYSVQRDFVGLAPLVMVK